MHNSNIENTIDAKSPPSPGMADSAQSVSSQAVPDSLNPAQPAVLNPEALPSTPTIDAPRSNIRQAPEFVPQNEPMPKPASGPKLPSHTLRVEYEIRILGGDESVTEIKSQFDLPLALSEQALARTDCDFSEVFDKIVVAPLVTQVRTYLQGRFEGYQEARAKKVVPEPPVQPHSNGGLKLPKFPDGVPVVMSPISPKPIIAKMPGSFPPPVAKNGG